jgi:hypothetical protein
MLPVTTARILAEKALQETCGQQCVDWAIGMLERGHDRPSLLQLAGMLPPHNHFEIAALRDRAMEELRIVEVLPSEAIRAYADEVLRFALAGNLDLIKAIEIVSDLCIADGYPRDLMDLNRFILPEMISRMVICNGIGTARLATTSTRSFVSAQ